MEYPWYVAHGINAGNIVPGAMCSPAASGVEYPVESDTYSERAHKVEDMVSGSWIVMNMLSELALGPSTVESMDSMTPGKRLRDLKFSSKHISSSGSSNVLEISTSTPFAPGSLVLGTQPSIFPGPSCTTTCGGALPETASASPQWCHKCAGWR